jgi:CBS domain-containing protein
MTLKTMRIRDQVTTGITTVGIDASIARVIDTMAEADVSSVVVTYPNGTGAGIISSFDIVRTYSEKAPEEWKTLTAGDVMSDGIIDIAPEKTLGGALKLMVENNVHRVVLLSPPMAGGKPVGILSATDIVKKLRGR